MSTHKQGYALFPNDRKRMLFVVIADGSGLRQRLGVEATCRCYNIYEYGASAMPPQFYQGFVDDSGIVSLILAVLYFVYKRTVPDGVFRRLCPVNDL